MNELKRIDEMKRLRAEVIALKNERDDLRRRLAAAEARAGGSGTMATGTTDGTEGDEAETVMHDRILQKMNTGCMVFYLVDEKDPLSLTVVDCNEAASTANGMSRLECIGLQIGEVFPAVGRTTLPATLADVALHPDKSTDYGEFNHDGDSRLSSRVLYLRIFGLQHRQVAATFDNITARKKVELELLLHNRSMASSSEGISIMAATEGIPVAYVNPAFLRLTEYSEGEVMGKNMLERLKGPKTNAAMLAEAKQAMAELRDVRLELELYRKGGSTFWTMASLTCVRDPETDFVSHFIAVLSDISSLKALQEQLSEEQKKSDRLLLNILPESISQQLKGTHGTIAQSYPDATILFADIVNFTQMCVGHDPISIVNSLNVIFSMIDELAVTYRLEKIKTIGDAYMCVGGLPNPSPGHTVAMALMATEVIERSKKLTFLGKPFQFRIGIAVGCVVAGVIGTQKFIYDCWGPAVNVASRMESNGVGGQIQVTEKVAERLLHLFECHPRGRIRLKGYEEPVPVYLLGPRQEGGAPQLGGSAGLPARSMTPSPGDRRRLPDLRGSYPATLSPSTPVPSGVHRYQLPTMTSANHLKATTERRMSMQVSGSAKDGQPGWVNILTSPNITTPRTPH